ncbi:MAG TPA: NAD(P)/FAD-dependent oxidoreductase [Burkholderiales bacterium]
MIGAGAAGLAAADALARAGRSALLLEARERVGGRCFTRRMAGLDIPVELGAEFIHGDAHATRALLRAARVAAVDSVRAQRLLERGRLRPVNGFAEAQRAVRGVSLERDISFQRLLARSRLPGRTRALASLMVQGFDAADPKRVSARSIVEEWREGGSLGDSQPRPEGGYGPVFDWLARSLVARGVPIHLQRVVQRIEWRRGSALVRGRFLGEPFAVRAQRVVITLPLGVLQSGAVRFIPSLPKKKALQKLASGPVIRVAMRFDRAFWERRAPGVAFFHDPRAPFPTFWTPLPMRAPLLTAWAGGPKAARLSGASGERLLARAWQSVRSVFPGAPPPAAALVHDWAKDPFARGGYSYERVGGEGAREALAAPLEDTLYFAGEATDTEEGGTVAGALRSGRRAARQIVELRP